MSQENETISIDTPVDLYDGIALSPPALVVVYGNNLGKAYYLQQKVQIIGRSLAADIHLDEDSVSREHARVRIERNATMVSDLDSTNGVFVNGHRVHEAQLKEGDRLHLGETILKYISGSSSEARFLEDVYRLMTVDDLTQAFNRQYFQESLKREISRVVRYRRSLSLAMLDIDQFKMINDAFGHLAGDEILKAFVALVSRNIRQSDLLARYGGDEFAIILPEAGPDAALKFCEKLRAMVEAHDFQFQGQAIEVTTSVGLQSYEHTDGGKTVRQLVAAADAHLYEAKKSGRNRICTGRFT